MVKKLGIVYLMRRSTCRKSSKPYCTLREILADCRRGPNSCYFFTFSRLPLLEILALIAGELLKWVAQNTRPEAGSSISKVCSKICEVMFS